MIVVNNVSLWFVDCKLFEDVNIKFISGNCYGLIGVNGVGKLMFLKVFFGEIEFQIGDVYMSSGECFVILKQNYFEYEEYEVLKVVIMGYKCLYEVMQEKDVIYMKFDFLDEDGICVVEFEGEFVELNGWEVESEVVIFLKGFGILEDFYMKKMEDFGGLEKVKVFLVQVLFGKLDVLLFDELMNYLDFQVIQWLEEFLINFENIVIVVFYDCYFLNKVCIYIVDFDFNKI